MANNKGFQGDNVITSVENVYKNTPSLPANIKDVLVNIIPWLALVFGIWGIIVGLREIGISPVGAMGGVQSGALLLLTGVLTIVASVLMVVAFPKLRKNDYGGWKLLFWSGVVSFASSILSLSLAGIIVSLIWAAIIFYLLFQIKGRYK